MRKTDKGVFKPTNPGKYAGDPNKITYRSSWELTVMNYIDAHPHVVRWSSETLQIPYKSPITGKWTIYIPDLIVVMDDGKGTIRVELVEIKPLAQTPGFQAGLTESGRKKKVSKYNLAEQAKNQAKWAAAMAFCKQRGWHFQVMTEHTLFGHTSRKKK